MAVITNPISNIPQNEKSHVLGWSQTWENQLNASINHRCTPAILLHDVVFIDHGANFSGALNLFGGATQEIFTRINILLQHREVVSLDHEMPDWGEQLRKRIGNPTTFEGITDKWCDMVSARCKKIPFCKQEHLPHKNITVGDSHSIAFSAENDRVYRNDGKTLHGALTAGLKSLLRGTVPEHNVNFSLGSIDIRHHILRHSTVVEELVLEYIDQGKALEDEYGCSVSYSAPVPVEWEGRKIPKTGYYKKTPFYGSMQERRDITLRFIDTLYAEGADVIMPPEEWYTMDGEHYAKTIMEFGGSFHIAPPFYRRNNWNESLLG